MQLGPGFRVFQTSPGDAVEIFLDEQLWKDSTGEVELTRFNRGFYNTLRGTFFSSGVIIEVDVRPYRGVFYMNYNVKAPRSSFQKTIGILGTPDENPSNEFSRRGDDNPLPHPMSDAQLFPHLQTCKAMCLLLRVF